jgi:hypothetical protein
MILPDMIAAGKYDWVDPDITAETFPAKGIGKKQFRAKLFDFGRNISSDDVVAAMKKQNFKPGDHIHGLAFGVAFPEEHRKHPIACLGSSAQVLRNRFAVCLDRVGDERNLSLNIRGGRPWGDRWRFLAVQEVSVT